MFKHAVIGCILALSNLAGAQTFIVDPAGAGDYFTIQTAVQWAPDGSTILIEPGVYGGQIDFNSRNLTLGIVDDAPEGSVILTGGNEDFDGMRILDESDVVLNGLVFQPLSFNAVKVENSNVTLHQCRIEDGLGTGLTVYHDCDLVTVSECVIANMKSSGIRIRVFHRGEIRILDSVIRDNDSGPNLLGGGISVGSTAESTVLVQRTEIIRNSSNTGGGIFKGPSSESLTIDSCLITHNVSSSRGGGLHAERGNMHVIDTILAENTSFIDGGGAYLNPDDYSLHKFSNCQISGNNAIDGRGGGVLVNIFNNYSNVRFKNCELTNNVAGWDGGGIGNVFSIVEVELYDSLICDNWPNPAFGDLFRSNTPVVDTCDIGACCLEDYCVQLTVDACEEAAGTWHGANMDCAKIVCYDEAGACCFGAYCLLLTSVECAHYGGDYHGAGTLCAAAACEKPKPGDLTRDGTVDIKDLLKLLTFWGS